MAEENAMYFDFPLIPIFLVGCVLVVFAKRVASPRVPRHPGSDTAPAEFHNPVQLWAMRIAGIGAIAFGLFIATNPGVRYRTEMGKAKNKLALLELGQVTEGRVTKAYYCLDAPEGWAVHYTFTVQDVDAVQEKEFSGNCEGPKKYFSELSPGDAVPVIYLPNDPRINCEVNRFLNYPPNRIAFKKAGKLGLLDRFRDEYELKGYSFEEWSIQQHEK